MPGYSPKYPLTFDPSDGYYEMNKTVVDAIRQNVKNLVMTIPGERIMDPEYGVGLSRYLFETVDSGIESLITSEIEYQMRNYLPQVALKNVSVSTSQRNEDIYDHSLIVKITYYIPSFGIVDQITIKDGTS